MKIFQAGENDFETVKQITHKTICEIYPKYYPNGAVQFFLHLHCNENIRNDIASGSVFILEHDGKKCGTVTVKENAINRLFVLSEEQHKGYGRALLDFAEDMILKSYDTIQMDASFPAKKIYRQRGYIEKDYVIEETGFGDYLCYDVMEKSFTKLS